MIATARLRLRPLSFADVPKLFAMSTEASLARWLPDQVYADEAEAEAVVRAMLGEPDPRERPRVFGVEDAATGELVGHVGLSVARGSIEIGYAIEARRHGEGLATEAVRAVADWARGELGLPEILGIVDADNAPSRRVLEKAGFGFVGEDERKRLVYRR